MTPDAKDAPSTLTRLPTTIAPNAQRGRGPGWGLRLLHSLLLVALGGWLLTRGLQTLLPDTRLPVWLAFAGIAAQIWGVLALIVGAALLVAALTLPAGRAWAWLGAATAALVALALVISAWFLGAGGDWLGAQLALTAAVLLAAPAARALYLA